METNIANLSAFRPNTSTDSNLRSWQAERTAVAAISNEQHLDVTLVTDEGDKVTLSLDARAAAMYGSYEQAAADGQGFSAAKGEFSVGLYERDMTFSVEGDLSEEEQKDIGKALKTLDQMMHNFVNGDLKPMMAKMDKLQGLDSLAGIQANMSFSRTVLVARQSQQTAVYGPAQEPAVPADQAPAPSSDAPEALLEDKADKVGSRMADVVAAAQSPVDRMLAFVNQLLDDYRQQMATSDPVAGRMIDRIAGQLSDALDQFNDQFNGLGDNAALQAA